MTLVQINKRAKATLDKSETERFCRLQNDQMWIVSNEAKLRKDFAGKYIAVENQTVRYVGRDIEELIANILKNRQHVYDFAIDFIGQYPTSLLL